MRWLIAVLLAAPLFAANVLIVADEVPAMQTLARELKDRANIDSEIVAQDRIPATLTAYRAVFVYIHRDIAPASEHTFIGYARNGGRLILLHHSISSGKRKNKEWLPFLGVELPERPLENGGYKYFDPANFEMVNVAPSNPVMKGAPDKWEFRNTEVYVNHVYSGQKTPLLAIRYTEPKSGMTFEQPSGAWYMRTGKGDVFYFMAGHNTWDFEQPAYAQIIANSVVVSRECLSAAGCATGAKQTSR